MKKNSPQNEGLRNRLAEIGIANYARYAAEINITKANIQLNREGKIPLTAVAIDGSKVSNRMSKEEGFSMADALERVNGIPNFQDVSIVGRVLRLSRSVCRVLIGSAQGNSGFGTGFMIAPRVMMTNNHVLPDMSTAARSYAQFNYELNDEGRAMEPVSFKLMPNELFFTSSLERRSGDDLSGLDFTIVAVEEVGDQDKSRLQKFDFVRLDGSLGKIIDGETCVVIQHPKGDYKKIVLKDIRMITANEDVLIYESDTQPGSSGSPVFGMGTAQVVALHHTGVPRTDAQGNWLRKDGGPVQPGDPDDAIDWIGNEGIRISRIVDAIRRASLADGMDKLRESILVPEKRSSRVSKDPEHSTVIARSVFDEMNPAGKPQSFTPTTMPHASILKFELLLSKDRRLRDAWREKAAEVVPGFISTTQLFPNSTDPFARRVHYLVLMSDGQPWKLAAEIETLPYVEACTPDLPSATDVFGPGDDAPRRTEEGFLPDVIYDDGTAEPNEDRFIKDWQNEDVIKSKLTEKSALRNWNWRMVNWDGVWNAPGPLRTTLTKNLARIRFVQLDTGYTRHSKIKDNLDLDKDLNFVDGGADAFDPKHGFGFKHPGHGTRTGSLTIGRPSKTIRDDGNQGLLTNENGDPFVKLIPYRVAERVALLGNGKDMVDGARTAIDSGTDVIFMCMGSHPRPMINAVVREAYERGVIWVCAAGNEVETVVAPAMYPGTIAVAAINPSRRPWHGSSNGPQVDIAAPGEDVYVPFWDKNNNEIMVYGNGTSYATPHVAAAAVLWKALHYDALRTKYTKPWQIVEAFRRCLIASKQDHHKDTKKDIYGKGILDISKLLNVALPRLEDKDHAYAKEPPPDPGDLGIREGLHYLWNTFKRKLTKDPTESMATVGLTDRGAAALEALGALPSRKAMESTTSRVPIDQAKLLREMFNTVR